MKQNEVRFEDGVAYLQLRHGKEVMVDEVAYPLVKDAHWCAMRTVKGSVYAITSYKTSDGKSHMMYMHRLLMKAEGSIRHKNGEGLDNRLENLEVIVRGKNAKRPKRRYRGVVETPEGFQAVIRTDFVPTVLGTFETAEEAAEIYNKAATEVYGDKARLNVIRTDVC